jgi:glycosyltransferase involved in cell wall biosynthesis
VEGFGYTFVEGWLCGKPVIGRDIPEVTQDFVAAGMKHGSSLPTSSMTTRSVAFEAFLARPPPITD